VLLPILNTVTAAALGRFIAIRTSTAKIGAVGKKSNRIREIMVGEFILKMDLK
jgi:hypothetical protein